MLYNIYDHLPKSDTPPTSHIKHHSRKCIITLPIGQSGGGIFITDSSLCQVDIETNHLTVNGSMGYRLTHTLWQQHRPPTYPSTTIGPQTSDHVLEGYPTGHSYHYDPQQQHSSQVSTGLKQHRPWNSVLLW